MKLTRTQADKLIKASHEPLTIRHENGMGPNGEYAHFQHVFDSAKIYILTIWKATTRGGAFCRPIPY